MSVRPLIIEPGSPWENSYIESFNGKMRDELLDREIFYSLKEELIQGIVDRMPAAWQYPEIACARAILEGQEFKTENFRETPWKQTSEIVLHGERIGYLELDYLEKKPESD
ncbi:unnamed protein product, partial [marine sediment metagenome]